MTDEEKKAVDILQNVIADTVIGDYCVECCTERINCKDECWIQETFDTINNLIEKQQKQIDEQSDLINRMKIFLLKRKLMCDFLEENK